MERWKKRMKETKQKRGTEIQRGERNGEKRKRTHGRREAKRGKEKQKGITRGENEKN